MQKFQVGDKVKLQETVFSGLKEIKITDVGTVTGYDVNYAEGYQPSSRDLHYVFVKFESGRSVCFPESWFALSNEQLSSLPEWF